MDKKAHLDLWIRWFESMGLSDKIDRDWIEALFVSSYGDFKDPSEDASHSLCAVHHPSYYQSSSMEAIEIIEAFDLDFHLGNAMKYILRAGKKDCEETDIRKAIWYLQRKLSSVKKAD